MRRGTNHGTIFIVVLFHVSCFNLCLVLGAHPFNIEWKEDVAQLARIKTRQASHSDGKLSDFLQACENISDPDTVLKSPVEGSCNQFYLCDQQKLYQASCIEKQAFDGNNCVDAASIPGCEHLNQKELCYPPCLNGGYCISRNACQCMDNYTGHRCMYQLYSGNANVSLNAKSDIHGIMCTMFGAGNVITFDGLVYDFPGVCQYEMVSFSGTPDFKVLVRKSPYCTMEGKYQYNLGNCITKITVYISASNLKVTITNAEIAVNDETISVPYDGHGIMITLIQPFVILTLGDMTLKYDRGMSAVHVLLHAKKFIGKTQGLCGNYNSKSADDLVLRQGETMEGAMPGHVIAKTWVHRDVDGSCSDMQIVSENFSDCQASQDVQKICNILLSRFTSCHNYLDPSEFFSLCKKELCRCNYSINANCHCDVVTLYSRSCALVGGKPPEWRTENQCYRVCPQQLQWMECGQESSQTCSMPRLLPGQDCFDRCQCPAGTYGLGSECIALPNCPCNHRGVEYKPGDRSSIYNCNDCVCTSGQWECESSLCPSTAQVFGFAHYKTFDDTFFSFVGHCQYVFAKDCVNNTFLAHLDIAKCGSSTESTCLKSFTLRLFVGSQTQEIAFREGESVKINRYSVDLPYQSGDLHVYRESSLYIRLRHSSTGIDVLWNGQDNVYMTVPQQYQGKLCGIAGNYNGNGYDDFTSPQKVLESTVSSFVNSWKINQDCPDVPNNAFYPCRLNSEKEKFATTACRNIYDDRFWPCHGEVDPRIYYTICVNDFCDCEKNFNKECTCDAFAAYARRCSALGIHLEWRFGGFCEISCSGGAVFQTCGSGCGKSCKSLAVPEECSGHCVEGCNCPDQTYLDPKGICVAEDACPCYHVGIWYNPGDTLRLSGVLCQCSRGRLVCEGEGTLPSPCPAGQIYYNCSADPQNLFDFICPKTCKNRALPCPYLQCTSGCACPKGLVWHEDRCIEPSKCPCYHNSKAYLHLATVPVDCNECTCYHGEWRCTERLCDGECSVSGLSHFKTFDQKWFDFSGDCEYVMATDECNSSEGTFKVFFKSIPCDSLGLVCSRTVTVQLGTKQIVLRKNHRLEAGTLFQTSGTLVSYTVSKHGFFVILTTNVGVTVLWDEGTRLLVQLSSSFKGKVCGLCGDFNDNPNNDFTLRSRDVVTGSLDFGNNWRLKESCSRSALNASSDMCEVHQGRKAGAIRQCSIIESEVFAECMKEIDHTKYLEHCLSDTCACEAGGSCECFCTAVAAYAHSCGQKGIFVEWRTPSICPTMCEHYNKNDTCEWRYEACGTSCPVTCCHRNAAQCSLPCVEGCHPNCLPGHVFSVEEQSCILEAECLPCPTTTAPTLGSSAVMHTSIDATVTPTAITPGPSADTSTAATNFSTTTGGGLLVCRKDYCLDKNNVSRQVEEIWSDENCDWYKCKRPWSDCYLVERSSVSNCMVTKNCSRFEEETKKHFGPDEQDPEPCCEESVCVCKNDSMLATLCPEWNKTCLPHEKKLTVPSEECCPQYQCKCDKCLLPNGSAVEINEKWQINACISLTCNGPVNESSCPTVETFLDKTKFCLAPPPNFCAGYQEIHEITYAEGDVDPNICCPEYSCRCNASALSTTCPQWFDRMNCSVYQQVVNKSVYHDPSECCPALSCVCKPNVSEMCDQWYDFKCGQFEFRTFIGLDPATGGCCPSFTCDMVQNVTVKGR